LNELQREHSQVAALQAEVSELRRLTAQLVSDQAKTHDGAEPTAQENLPQ
jgi:hypothetical protein